MPNNNLYYEQKDETCFIVKRNGKTISSFATKTDMEKMYPDILSFSETERKKTMEGGWQC